MSTIEDVLKNQVQRIKDGVPYNTLDKAFEHWMAENIIGLTAEEATEAVEIGGMGDRSIDIFHQDQFNKLITIGQAKWSEDLSHTVPERDIVEFLGAPKRLLEATNVVNENFKAAQKIFKKAVITEGYSVRLVFVTAGNYGPQALDEIKIGNSSLANNYDLQTYNIDTILSIIGQPRSRDVKIKIMPQQLTDFQQADEKRLVATIKAKQIVEAYEKIGDNIFSRNPRVFLGKGKKIHKEVLKTLEDPTERSRFWYYNNGISATCEDYFLDNSNNELTISNLKIVNGCQTIISLNKFDTTNGLDDSVEVLLKISKVPESELATKISRYTNTQNAITDRDLVSDEESQIILKSNFETSDFFWEQKRGDYDMLDTPQQNRYSPKELFVIDSVSGAKLRIAFDLFEPHNSIKLAQEEIFDPRESVYQSIFNDGNPLNFIIPKILFYSLKQYLQDVKNNTNLDEEQKDIIKLLSLNIGYYQILAILGNLIQSFDDELKQKIIQAIYNLARNRTFDNLKEIAGDVTRQAVSAIRLVMDSENPSPFNEKSQIELKAILVDAAACHRIWNFRNTLVSSSGPDIVKTKLEQLTI